MSAQITFGGGVKRITLSRRDSVAVDTMWLLNYWLQTKIDSAIAANPTAADSLFGRRPHDWNAAQRWLDTLAHGETAYPWLYRIVDTTTAFIGMPLTFASWTNGPAGAANYGSTVFGLQYNPDRADATQPHFGTSLESKYYVSGHWHSEFHEFFNGVGAQLGVRPSTWIGRWGDGRVTSRGFGADIMDFYNGGGANNRVWDSLTIRIYLRGGSVGPTGVLGLLNGTLIRADAANSTIIQTYNGTAYVNVLAMGGNTQAYVGSSGLTDINLQAGSKTFILNETGVISTNIFVGADAADSLGVIGFNQWGHLVKRWNVTIAQVNARISAALDSAFTLPGRKLNLANVSTSGAADGEYLRYTTANGVSWEPVTSSGVSQVNTSAPITGGPITSTGTIGITQATTSTDGYVSSADWNSFAGKAARNDIRDSLRRNLYLQDTWTGHAMMDGRYDSTKLVLVDALGTSTSYTYGWSAHQELFTTDDVVILDRLTVRHSCDSIFTSGGISSVSFWRFRDTTFMYSVRDSIPAGAKVWMYYSPASDMTIWNSTRSQIVGVFYTLPNDHTAYLIGNKVQVPRIVDNTGTAGRKIVASQAGYRTSIGYGGGTTQYNHILRASVRVHRKVVGLNY